MSARNPKPHSSVFRVLSLLVILSVILSCNFLAGGGLTPSTNVEIPQNLSLGGMEQVEQEMRNIIREPAREVLGADADAMFTEADKAYEAIYMFIAQQVSFGASRPPGYAQFEAFNVTFGMLIAFQNDAMKSDGGPVNVKSTEKINENTSADFAMNFSREGSKIVGDVAIKITITKDGNSLVEDAKGKLETDTCPDPSGQAQVKFDLNINTTGTTASASGGGQLSFVGSGSGHVNDDASLTSLDLDVTSGLSTQGAKTGGQIQGVFAETHVKASMDNLTDAANVKTNVSAEVTRKSSQATQEAIDKSAKQGVDVGSIFVYISLLQAEDLWKNGYCVEIQLSGAQDSNQVKPEEKKNFTATVRHKFEGADIEAPITATLSGEKSLTPQEKSNSPVNYTYEAPKEKDKQATITLETRSKRGAAKKEITFNNVQLAFTVSGTLDQMSFSGTICDPYKPFVVNASGGGATAVLNFTPNGESLDGSFTFSGGGNGFTLSGQGTYRINAGSGGGSLEMDRSGCVDIGACNSKLETLTLTPLDDPSACKG